MSAIQPAELFSSLLILAAALAMTGASMWAGGRLAPWFLKEPIAAPSVRTLILSDDESEVSFKMRVAACGLSLVVMLAGLLAMVAAARFAGWSPSF